MTWPRHFRFALLNPTVLENGTNYNVVVLRTNGFTAGDGTVRVTLTTIDGSAVSPADYVALTTTLDFVNGQTSMTVPILIVDNSVVAGNKLLTLTLSGATDGAGILTPSTTLTIVDNDPIAGSPDGSFNPGTGPNAAVQALARTAPASWSSAATSPVSTAPVRRMWRACWSAARWIMDSRAAYGKRRWQRVGPRAGGPG